MNKVIYCPVYLIPRFMKRTIIVLPLLSLFCGCDSLQNLKTKSRGIDKVPDEFFELGEVQMSKTVELVNLDMVNNLPVFSIEINGKKYRFLIDTGALTIVPREVFKDLGLSVKYRGMFNDINNQQSQVKDFVIVPSLKVNNIEFNNIGAVAFSIENDLMNCLYDGILGANALAQLKWKFDFSNNKAYASKSLDYLITDSIDYSLDFTTNRQKTPFVKGQVLNQPFNFMFDTGYSATFCVPNNYDFYKENTTENNFITVTGVQTVGVYGASNATKSFQMKTDLEIDQATFSNQFVSGASKALLGSEFLMDFVFILDWENQKIQLQKNENTKFKNKLRSFGFGALFVGDKLKVLKTVEEAQIPLQIGDEILSINNHVFENICDYFLDNKEKELDEIEVKIKRGNDTLNFSLQKQIFLK